MLIVHKKTKRRSTMSQVYCIRTRKKGKHLTFEEREELEAIVNKNNKLPKNKRLSKRQIARIMGVRRVVKNFVSD